MTTFRKLVVFHNRFAELKPLTGIDFVLDLNENFEMINAKLEGLKKIREASPELKKFQEAGAELYKKYAKKDSAGQEMTEMQQTPNGPLSRFIIDSEKQAEFNKEFDELTKNNKKVIEEAEKREKDYAEALDSEVKNLKFTMIQRKDIPKECNAGQLELLMSVGMVNLKKQ